MNILPMDISVGKKVLVVGAGGGFDFVYGLPIILELEKRGCTVLIGNYSFTNLANVANGEWHSEHLLKINANSTIANLAYFPEKHLSAWYRQEKGIEKNIWCFPTKGVVPTLESYNYLINKFAIDIIFCIDGGVDGISGG